MTRNATKRGSPRARPDVLDDGAAQLQPNAAIGEPARDQRRGLRAKLDTAAETALLLAIGDAGQPVGARAASRALAESGFSLSESTVTRLLRRLDERRLTVALGAKGRLLTDEGRALATLVTADRRRSEAFSSALDIHNVQDLRDILVARRGVEREAARAAAERATRAELQRLRELVERHSNQVAVGEIPRRGALEFHRLIGRASRNKLLAALSATVLAEETDALEQILDVVTQAHGTFEESAPEHLRLLRCLEARDADGAEQAMVDHLNRLIAETNDFASQDRGQMFDRLLAFVRRDLPTAGYGPRLASDHAGLDGDPA